MSVEMSERSDDGPILVFLGPTLRLADAEKVLDAVYLQPAAQGDILLAAHAFRPRAMTGRPCATRKFSGQWRRASS